MDKSKLDPFLVELTKLVNKHNRDSLTSTPDFILASYISRFIDLMAEYNPQTPVAPKLEKRMQNILDEMYINRHAWMAEQEGE